MHTACSLETQSRKIARERGKNDCILLMGQLTLSVWIGWAQKRSAMRNDVEQGERRFRVRALSLVVTLEVAQSLIFPDLLTVDLLGVSLKKKRQNLKQRKNCQIKTDIDDYCRTCRKEWKQKNVEARWQDGIQMGAIGGWGNSIESWLPSRVGNFCDWEAVEKKKREIKKGGRNFLLGRQFNFLEISSSFPLFFCHHV